MLNINNRASIDNALITIFDMPTPQNTETGCLLGASVNYYRETYKPTHMLSEWKHIQQRSQFLDLCLH